MTILHTFSPARQPRIEELIAYDRSRREYVVATGDKTAVFPAGATGKRQATRLAVFVAEPALYELASKLSKKQPHLETRAWAAAAYVVDGRVDLDASHGRLATVDGNSHYGAYSITHDDDGRMACDCVDWLGCTAPLVESGARYCKHIIAYVFAARLQEPPAPAEPAAPAARYGNGEAVEPDFLSHWRAYSGRYNRPPLNRQALTAWIYK
jgi:hypothetical protein